MNDPFLSAPVWKRFREFLAEGADRFSILDTILAESGIDHKIIPVAGNRHFLIAPPAPAEPYLRWRQTILTAHYDRSPGSPGANDNSAAVFILAETAQKLLEEKTGNWLVIFTDKEELGSGEGIKDQGAYTLAVTMRETKAETSRIFNFDACGTGDTLIISTTVDYLLKNRANMEKIHASIRELQADALEAARELRMEKVLLAPTPFSDDAGFLMAGIAVQTITMLPSEECSFVARLRKDPGFADALVNLELRNRGSHESIPETWRIMNSPRDSFLRLTPRNFRTVRRFAQTLCR